MRVRVVSNMRNFRPQGETCVRGSESELELDEWTTGRQVNLKLVRVGIYTNKQECFKEKIQEYQLYVYRVPHTVP